MKVREHRGSLDESMATVKEIEPTLDALTAHINEVLSGWLGGGVTADTIVIHPQGFDSRIGWNTYLVAVEGYGVFGMIDQFPEVGK